MKCSDVLKTLRVTRQTLCHYVKEGKIKVNKLASGRYDYDKESVFNFLNRENERKNVIYGRVSTSKQKTDLDNQIDDLKKFCINSSIIIHDIYKDIGSGINFDRKEFNRLLDDVVSGEISTVYVTYKDRLSRISFNVFKNLFAKFGTNIVIINEIEDTQTLETEIVKEIIDLIHCFSMKVYSKRRKKNLKKIEEIIKNVKEHD